MQHTVSQIQTAHIDSRALANVAYGAARCGRTRMGGVLFATLAVAAEQRLSEFKAQEIANTAWAFATMNHAHKQLFAALARAVERQLSEFNARDVANTA